MKRTYYINDISSNAIFGIYPNSFPRNTFLRFVYQSSVLIFGISSNVLQIEEVAEGYSLIERWKRSILPFFQLLSGQRTPIIELESAISSVLMHAEKPLKSGVAADIDINREEFCIAE